MKIRYALFALFAASLFAASTFAQQVRTDYDRGVNFSQYKTYSRGQIHTENHLWVERINTAVNSVLAAKGWTDVDSGGSISIMGMEVTETHRTLNTYYDSVAKLFGDFPPEPKSQQG